MAVLKQNLYNNNKYYVWNESAAKYAEVKAWEISFSNLGTSTNKVKYVTLNGEEFQIGIDVDQELSTTSTNPVENRALTKKILELEEEVEELMAQAYVPSSRTINGKALSSNITLTASDIGINISTTGSSTNKAKYITVDGVEYQLSSSLDITTVTSLTDLKTKDAGFYKYTGTIASTSGTWSIINCKDVIIAINTSDSSMLYTSTDGTNWYHTYGAWK